MRRKWYILLLALVAIPTNVILAYYFIILPYQFKLWLFLPAMFIVPLLRMMLYEIFYKTSDGWKIEDMDDDVCIDLYDDYNYNKGFVEGWCAYSTIPMLIIYFYYINNH